MGLKQKYNLYASCLKEFKFYFGPQFMWGSTKKKMNLHVPQWGPLKMEVESEHAIHQY